MNGSTYDQHGNQQDCFGNKFQTKDGKPPQSGTPVTIYDSNGHSKPGVWINNQATENKG